MRRKTREKPPSVSGFLLQYRQELMVNHGKGGLQAKTFTKKCLCHFK